ncbi:MAG: hypothetical protein CME62_01690 [Halobacteriovoraceae bacterium]|nr:hypothetical protein [Halobacteriovoraceae bacterium]|tara:strand:+ start:7932 stop:8825 length:894 start_codon:yes stop_codon:yes gene_type:complete
MHADISLLRHQGPMLNVVANILLKAIKNGNHEIKEHLLKSEYSNVIPNPKLVDRYHKWLDCESYYEGEIAPHLFPLWTYPQLYELGKSLNLPLHKVLNQGVKMIINSPLKRNSGLTSKAEIYQIQNMDSKYRVSQRLTTGTHLDSQALISEIYAVILKDTKSALKKKGTHQPIKTDELSLVERLVIAKEDAKSYAYLSGDVNPIHLSKAVAKLMGLRGSIMHGFGLFAIVFEKLRAQGFEISEIDVRFIKPVYLGSEVDLYISESAKPNTYGIKLISTDKRFLHVAGEFQFIPVTVS